MPGNSPAGWKKSHVEIYVGESDNIIRKVVAELVVEPKGSGEKVEIELEMTLGKVNEKQAIAAPAKSQPLAGGLFSELGINPDELLSLMQGGEGAGGLGGLLEGITGGGLTGEEGESGSSGGDEKSNSPRWKTRRNSPNASTKPKSAADIQKCASLME